MLSTSADQSLLGLDDEQLGFTQTQLASGRFYYSGSDTSKIGNEDPEEVMHAMQALYERSEPDWLPDELKTRLKILIRLRIRVWRTRIGPDPPCNVQPFKTSLKPGARPVRCGNMWNADTSRNSWGY